MPKEEKKKERKQRGNRVAKLVPSLALSTFGSVGLALLLVISGLFEEDMGILSTYLLSGCPFLVIAWVWLFSGVFISTRLAVSSSRLRVIAETFLSVNSFLAVLVSGFVCMYWVILSVSFGWLITIITLSGLCGVFHGWFLYFQRTRDSIDSVLAKIKKARVQKAEIFVKSLELEHNFFQSYFQQFVSAVMIFLTVAVVGYFLSSEQTSALSLINTSIMVTWFVIGLFFGLFIPVQNHLEYIRHVVRDIAVEKSQKQ